MEEKILRYLELSKLFEKNEHDIFKEKEMFGVTYASGGVYHEGQELKTRTQKAKEQAEKSIKLAEDWEEYKELQKNLINYYTAKQKLNGSNEQ